MRHCERRIGARVTGINRQSLLKETSRLIEFFGAEQGLVRRKHTLCHQIAIVSLPNRGRLREHAFDLGLVHVGC